TATAHETAKDHGGEMETQNAEGDNPEEDSNQDNEDDDDDDNDVCVTIGTINAGASSLCTIKSHSIRSTSLTVGSVGRPNPIAKALDLNALGDVQGIPLLWVDIEEKPWRKPGADISEYFNYGFNEDTWKAYCGKQRRIRAGWENFSASSRMKVQRGRTDPANKEFLFDRPSLCSVYQPDLRRLSGAIDVIGGQTATLSRQEGRRRNRGNAKQVLSEASRDSSANKMISFLRPNIPPPPLPPPLPNVSSGAQLLLLQRCLSPPPPGFSSMDRMHYKSRRDLESYREREKGRAREPGSTMVATRNTHRSAPGPCRDAPVTPYCSCSSGRCPLKLASMASWTGMIDSSKDWGYHTRASKEREQVKEHGRFRERGHDRERERERSRERERERQRSTDRSKDRWRERETVRDHCPSSLTHNRVAGERDFEHKHHRVRERGEKQRAKNRRHKASHRRRKDSQEEEIEGRHKRKKSRGGRST
ncbi:unnamed protein product, partial [Arctogadus glacialis]